MEREQQLSAAVKALDPAPPDAELPEALWSAAVVLRDIDTRSGTVTKTATRTETVEPTRRWRPALVAAAAFVAVIALGAVVWLAALRDSAPPADQPTTTSTTVVNEDASAISATPITTRFGALDAGTHALDTFDTPIVFTAENSVFFVQANSTGFFAMSAPNSRDPDDRDMVIVQLTALSDPAAPNASSADQGDGWPADDFGGWLDNLTDGISASNRTDTTLGGVPAIRVDLELTDIECLSGNSFCVLFDRTRRKTLNPGAKYRIWVAHEGLASPVAVILGTTGDPSDESWLAAYEQVLSTLEFTTSALP